MSTFGDAQVRKLYIANDAIDSTVPDSPAATVDDLAEGQVQAFKAAGNGIPTEKEKFYIASKVNGKISKSEIIDPDKVLEFTDVKDMPINATQYAVNLTGTISASVGKTVVISLPIDNYGANLGSANPYIFHASYVIQPGDSFTDLVLGLVTSGNDNANKTGIPLEFSTGTDVVNISVNRTPFKLGKFAGEYLKTRIYVKNDAKDELTTTITETTSPSSINGVEIANLEWFAAGNTGDQYRGMGYPNNFDTEYVAEPQHVYQVIDMAYYSERIPAPGDKQRAVITIALNTTNVPLAADFELQVVNPIKVALGL